MHSLRLSAPLLLLLLAACQSVGPSTVPRDRAGYSDAIGDSWKRQMLLNIVKLRYADVPVFVEVGQVVAGYSLEASLNASHQFSAGVLLGDSTTFGATGKYTDRPTITYVPLTGGRFMQEMLTPIPPAAVFRAIQSGSAADAMLWLGVSSINGIRNVRSGPDGAEEPDPRFRRVALLMREAQLSGALGVRVLATGDGGAATIVAIRSGTASEQSRAGMQELRELLGLPAGQDEFPLVLGDIPRVPGELAVQSRTLLGILQVLALRVDVPPEHVAEGRASAGIAPVQDQFGRLHFRVAGSTAPPVDAAVAVPYRDSWFYIDDRDLGSKRAFALIMMLFTLANTGTESSLPVLTIPTN
jgi:hypothetical protein